MLKLACTFGTEARLIEDDKVRDEPGVDERQPQVAPFECGDETSRSDHLDDARFQI